MVRASTDVASLLGAGDRRGLLDARGAGVACATAFGRPLARATDLEAACATTGCTPVATILPPADAGWLTSLVKVAIA
ncbi:MAG: hypothetical protein WKF30_03290 [Pyrinomonadaceae bacterium]